MSELSNLLVNKNQTFFRILSTLAAVFIISQFFPKSVKFKYEYELGKPWKYNSLISPVTYALYKSDAEISNEKKKLLENFSPYYTISDVVWPDVEKSVNQILSANEVLPRANGKPKAICTPGQIRMIRGILSTAYNNGIIELDETHRTLEDNATISLIKDGEVTARSRASLLTTRDALNFLIDDLNRDPNLDSKKIVGLINDAIIPNVTFEENQTKKFQNDALAELSPTSGLVQEGATIISKGSLVDAEKMRKLNSLRKAYEDQMVQGLNQWVVWAGYFLLTLLIFGIFLLYLRRSEFSIFNSSRKLGFIYALIALMLYIVFIAYQSRIPSLYVIPFCIAPIILRTFFGGRLALYTQILILLLAAIIFPLGEEYIFVQFAASIVAINIMSRVHHWSQFFYNIVLIFLAYAISYFGVSLIQEGVIQNINWRTFIWLAMNSLLTLLAFPLIPVFERFFGMISDISLTELGDTNKPLLKQLSLQAPGTFQHSLQVANLAEAAASEIGAQSLLVKVAALYHDVGKLANPIFFIENQNTDVNPHDEISFEQSADIIISHIRDGIEMAKQANLPDVLIDFIRTHHGTSRVEYFYQSYLKNFPKEMVDETKFRYPGPLPFTKETAILMVADSVEAASKSLKNPSTEDIDALVDGIVTSKINDGQFFNSNITFNEINRMKSVFKKMLKSIYHVRIKYPEIKEVEKTEASDTASV